MKKQNMTVTLTPETWKQLQLIKINGGYKTIDEVIRKLLGNHK
jgi:hypothetical protein